jgi:WD40 repeat protein/DNA-binding SARP family transcriptional activator
MRFRILGPLQVDGEEGPIQLAGAKPRGVLAVLLLHANEPVSAERIVAAVWGDEAVAGTVRTVQVHVSRLRKALEPDDIIATTPAGYCVRVRPGELDAEQFASLVDEGRRALGAGQAEAAATLLREALALWRGPALADLTFAPFAQAEIARLEEQRLGALEHRLDADLAAGRHLDVVGELRQLVASEPTRERLAGQLMLALYRCGRQAEALDAYTATRHTLVDEIGVEPGPELRRLQDAILRQDPSLDAPPGEADLPSELDPAGDPPLVGREAELAWLTGHWERTKAGGGAVLTVSGVSGIGKSRLVAEFARQVHELGATTLYASGSAEAVRATLDRAGRAERPTLLVLDHVDRTDPRLLAELTDAVRGRPVLAIALGDDPEALARLNGGNALALEPLDMDAVRVLAARYSLLQVDDDESVEWLHDASGGVPGRAHELAADEARRVARRRVRRVASQAAEDRATLRSSEAELTERVGDLQAASQRVAVAVGRGPPVVCPFKGLACFDVDDAPYFFGRERLVAELVARLVGAPMLGIVGPSGSGKSSVLRSGVLPALASGVLPGSDEWRQVVIRPGEHPMRAWREAVGDGSHDRRILVAVDQFEETFMSCRDERERAAFIVELARAAEPRGRSGVVVLAIRADYYGRCASYPELAPSLAANHVLVGPMRRDELRRAIECPAERVGLQVDPELTAAIVEDVADEPGALPLLSTALLELWPRRDGRRMRLAAYEQTGGVRGAVARLAEDAYRRLDSSQQVVARDVLMRLVAEGADGAVERHRVPLHELESDGGEDTAHVVDLLADRRLLTISDGAVEMAHEALLREWPRLCGWIDDDRENLRLQRSLTAAAHEWDRLDRDESELYRGARLTAANEWRAHHEAALHRLERAFLDASNARWKAERQARRRRINLAFAGLLGALAAISVVAIVALHQAREANHQREIIASRELALEAVNELDTDPGVGLAIALRALGRSGTPQAMDAVRRAAYAAHGTGVWQLHDDWLYSVRPSRDGRRVVTSGKDGTVRVWNVDQRRVESTIRVHRGQVHDAALSPDGQQVASAGYDDGTVTLTDLEGGHRRVVLDLARSGATPPHPVSVQFSPDGRLLAVAVTDGTVRLVPVDGGAGSRLRADREGLNSARFSPDAKKLVTAGLGTAAMIWDLAARTSIRLEHLTSVQSAVFSPDGDHVATAGGDGALRIWDARDGGRPTTITLGRQPLFSARYSPDGRRVVTAGGDGVVRVVDIRTKSAIAVFPGHRGQAFSADFIAGGAAVISGGEDGTLRTWAVPRVTVLRSFLNTVSVSPTGRFVTGGDQAGFVSVWDLARGTSRQLPPLGPPSFAKFSPDGTLVGSTSWDGRVRVSDPAGDTTRAIRSHGSPNWSVAVDPQATRIAVGGNDRHPRVLIVSLSGGRPLRLTGHAGAVYDVEFSPDGKHVLTASEDGTARIWNAHDGRLERTLSGHEEAVKTARYSPDGEFVVTAGKDGTARVWRVSDGSSRVLRGHRGALTSAAFNRRGDRIVTSGVDGTVRVWSAGGGDPLLVVDRHQGSALGAAFTPDGRVASVGDDFILRVVPCEVCGSFSSVLRLARARVRDNLSAADRARYLPRDG